MNKTIYLLPKDQAVWDRARGIPDAQGTGISRVIVALLRDYIAAAPRCPVCSSLLRQSDKFCPKCGREVPQ